MEKYNGVVTVVQQDGTYSCGIVVHPGMVVTSSDIADSNDEIRVCKRCPLPVWNSAVWKPVVATVRRHDDDKGFCLLDAHGLESTVAEIRPYDTLTIGETVSAVSWNPNKYVCDAHFQPTKELKDIYIHSGTIKQLQESESICYIQTDITLPDGASGGGLFGADGKLVGILTRKIAGGDEKDTAFAIPLDSVLNL